jgi:hypothetical protein
MQSPWGPHVEEAIDRLHAIVGPGQFIILGWPPQDSGRVQEVFRAIRTMTATLRHPEWQGRIPHECWQPIASKVKYLDSLITNGPSGPAPWHVVATPPPLSPHNDSKPPLIEDMIDLDQAAALVNRRKRTLQRYISDQKKHFPLPAVQGSGGKKSEWRYAELKIWLEKEFDRKLPDRPPHIVR